MAVRMERINSELQRAISEIINNDLRNPLIDNEVVTIVSVDTSKDLSSARVFIDVLQNDDQKKKKIIDAIIKSVGYIRHELSEKVVLRRVPNLTIIYDKNFSDGNKVMDLIDQLKKKGTI